MQGAGGAQGAGAARRRVRHGPRRQGQLLDPVPERQQLGAGHRRVHGGGRRGSRLAPERGHDRPAAAHRQGPRAVRSDDAGHLGVRRPGHAVRHDDQPLAHRPRGRPDQRQQPVLGVHAHRQQRLQSGVAQPADVPRGRRHVRRRGLQAGGRGRLHRAGDPRRQRRLPDRADRQEQPQVPAARSRATPTSARC